MGKDSRGLVPVEISKDYIVTGFLLRVGNRLFWRAVQINVTSCFTEICTKIIQWKGEIPLCFWENIAFPFQPMLWRYLADVTALKIHNLLKQSSLFLPIHPKTMSTMFPVHSTSGQGKPPIIHWETFTNWHPHMENNRKVCWNLVFNQASEKRLWVKIKLI